MRTAEAVNLADPASICQPIGDYPMDIYGNVVGLVDGVVKSCGSETSYDDCYDYDPDSNRWVGSPNMLYGRHSPRASSIDGTWLISGPPTTADAPYASEMWSDGELVSGPTVPPNMDNHCQITVNDTHVFFADGQDLGPSYLYDFNAQTWTEMPPKTVKTSRPSCGFIKNPDNGVEAVVYDQGITEIFNFNDMTWRLGPEMPWTSYSGFAQLSETFVMVGGNGYGTDLDLIFQFDNLEYKWILKGQHLGIERDKSPGVVAVPDDFVSCS